MSKIVYSSSVSMSERFAFAAAPLAAPVPLPGELEEMQEGVRELLEILSWARPHGSQAEAQFVELHVCKVLDGLGVPYDRDGFGNVWAAVPKAVNSGPDVLWSCHVDTVHASGGRQGVRFADDGQTVELVKRKAGRCLGADDGAGLWLMLEMIRARVPGGYVFHRGEEKGRLGSCYVVECEPERLQGWDACVAFDRRDYQDIITHQLGERCASEAFAASLSAALNETGRGLKYRADDTGSYTDSYSYMGVIPECTNVSVGYSGEHGPRETLDALHVWRLRKALVSADLSGLVIQRDPTELTYYGSAWGWGGQYDDDSAFAFGSPAGAYDAQGELLDLVQRFPVLAAELLDSVGITADDFLEAMSPAEFGQAMGRR
ncbi:hypothetical protein ACQKOE_09990 [Novosphingobium sp. NPDC080210]|uniref:hypothetical protein n=1 Tax=Novosphingobium sp. NPDC080210 TaxID=3390596 RepID=UPI003D063A28